MRLTALLAIAAASVAMILTAQPSLADAAPPISPGDAVGVPSGAVQDVFIEHEDLTMDLSSLSTYIPYGGMRAAVQATYQLRNDGAAKGIDLVFVTASQNVAGVQVVLDGQTVDATLGPLGPVPASWMPPTGTPPLQAGPDIPYGVDRPAGLTFHIALSSGRHRLVTSYQAAPTEYSGDAYAYEPHFWQLAFVLSPARQWEGFGDLAVTVRVPSGWPAAVRPALVRSGDALTGHFDGIPANAIGVTTRMPTPPDWTRAGWLAGSFVAAIGSVIAGWLFGRRRRWPLLLGLGPILVGFPAILVSASLQMRYDGIPAGQESWFGAKGVGFAALGQTFEALVVGLILGQVGLVVGAGTWAAWRKVRGKSG